MEKNFFIYHVICVAYLLIMATISWRKNGTEGALGITPALDTLVIIILGWVLAPIDLFITFKRLYTEAKNATKKESFLS